MCHTYCWSFGSWSIFMIVLKNLFYWCLFLDENVTLKGHVPDLSSYWINNYLNSLLSIPHPNIFSFMYEGDKFLGIWKDLYWYGWLVCLWACWRWFWLLFCWKLLSKFMLTIGSIMVEECDDVISTSDFSRFSKTFSTLNLNVLDSRCLYNLVQM